MQTSYNVSNICKCDAVSLLNELKRIIPTKLMEFKEKGYVYKIKVK